MLSYILGGFYKIESLPNYLARFLARPDAGLWFLWVLAFGLLAMMAGRLLELRIGRVAYLFLIVLFFIAPIRYLGVPLLRYYFPCIVTGYLLRNAVVDMKRFLPYVLPISLVVFVAVFPFWHRTYEQVTAPAQVIIEGHQLSIRPFVYIGAKYAEACSGSALAVWTAFLLYNYLRMTLLQWLGRRSLEIYVSHQLFIYAFPARSAIAIAGAFCFALAMSLIVIQVIGRIPGARELLYGVPWMSCEMQAPNPGNVEEQCTQLALPANLRGAYWNK
jgi:fucose 4-O-acetylase-like acetyltransferase